MAPGDRLLVIGNVSATAPATSSAASPAASSTASSYSGAMPKNTDFDFPRDHGDERELLLEWLVYLRGAVIRNISGVGEEDAHRRPDGKLLPLAGIVNHLVGVERRWIDGGMLGGPIVRTEEEFFPGPELTVTELIRAYRERAENTDRVVRTLAFDAPNSRREGTTLRWTLLHLINETARHAGHADAVRELIDGSTGE
jgi:uncharacterized damage-inducible protein DinB